MNFPEKADPGISREKKHPNHDMNPLIKSVPSGILTVVSGELSVFFGTSAETGDFISDCIEMRWDADKGFYGDIKESVINTDSGPDTAGNRTQFIRRMVESADNSGLIIRSAYYPPYHSRYNPVERCRGASERHRNGGIPDSVETASGWANTMTWKGINPVVRLCDTIYGKGISLTEKEMKPYEKRLRRSEKLPVRDILIQPKYG